MQKQIPIIFSKPMVAAILKNTKDITRRKNGLENINKLIELEIPVEFLRMQRYDDGSYRAIFDTDDEPGSIKCPYGGPGDLLWVREASTYVMLDHAHDLLEGANKRTQWVYKASMHEDWMQYAKEKYGYKWKPSIHMPKAAARIYLEVVSVRPERLNNITEDDAWREGVLIGNNADLKPNYYDYETKTFCFDKAKTSFITLWDSINGKESYKNNPWVWRVEFKRVKAPI
jgi:hypothetical protein